VASEKPETLRDKVKGVVENILPASDTDLNKIKGDIWTDLATLYYKYDDEDQKRAFREIMYAISNKIQKGEWKSVYKKLHKLGPSERPF